MNIVFFVHPSFLPHQSMPRFAKMLTDGMEERGHNVRIWAPSAFFFKLPVPESFRKWMSYIDQYVIFPLITLIKLRFVPKETLFVFTDHALGPWVPLVVNRPHVIHCHDFLAQNSALGKIKENAIGWSGKKYQSFIRQGYTKGKNFISVSSKTKQDLEEFLTESPLLSEVVYNGLNQTFVPLNQINSRKKLSVNYNLDLGKGFILHVGGNLWYKNRKGVIEIYNAWRMKYQHNLPLLMIGQAPTSELRELKEKSVYCNAIYFLENVSDNELRLAYAGASVFLFPSIAEGFGWPIAEAMASGCLVVTTNSVPMSEVGGESAYLVPPYPFEKSEINEWAENGAEVMNRIFDLSESEKKQKIQECLINASRFDRHKAIDRIEEIYNKVILSK